MSGKRRDIDIAIDIDADPATVWEAISDAEQLRRWFPLDARVEPGEGGSITLSWGPGMEATAPIRAWEPGRRLSWLESMGADPETGEPVEVAVDLRIEGRGGSTRLRLVHSGFEDDAKWDDYLATLDSGWRYFLFNLKHYLERHRGRPRRMVWDRRQVEGDKDEVWRRLLSIYGVTRAESGATAELWGGHRAEVVTARAPIHLVLQVPELDDALLLVELEPGSGRFSIGTWLSLYGDAGAHGDRLEGALGRAYAGTLDAAPGS